MIPSAISSTRIHKVAILRQEGTNGDREMTSAFYRGDECIDRWIEGWMNE
jgi:phosphoribosylformylglycinamidine (FGAM) synthase-like amidotransferase family enzyme